MSLKITSKQMEITPAIRNHVEARLEKLKKWHAQLINPHFILRKEPDGFSVDAIINTPMTNLIASAKNEDMYQAINDVTVKLEKQLDKSQHKHETKRGSKTIDITIDVEQ